MEFKDRIKILRKTLHLTQQEFSDAVGVSRGVVSMYEIGKAKPSEAVISLICRQFRVREEWLRTGEGEMFRLDKDAVMLSIRDALPNLIDDAARVVEMFADLPHEDQRKTIDFIRRVSVDLFDAEDAAALRAEFDAEIEAEKKDLREGPGNVDLEDPGKTRPPLVSKK